MKKIIYLLIFFIIVTGSIYLYFRFNSKNETVKDFEQSDFAEEGVEAITVEKLLPNPTEEEPNLVVHTSTFTEPPISGEILTLLENMTLEEKIGQMIFAGIDGTNYDQATDKLIHQYYVGGIIFNKKNFLSVDQTIQFVNQIKSQSTENPLPLFLGVDQEGGRVAKLPGNLTPIPTSLQIGNVESSEFSYSIGELLGTEVISFGFNMNFAPVLDVNSNPNNPVIGDRSFGNTAELVSQHGVETMKGIHSKNVIAVVKHFPGHGDTNSDSHLVLPKVNKSLEELEQLELIPFKEAIQEGADVVMIAHILLPQIDGLKPSSMSEIVITDILRNQMDFDGVVITDDMTMQAITDHYDIGTASVQSVKAGSDIIMVAHDYNKVTAAYSAIHSAVVNGEITEKRINDSVIRIMQLKEKYKLNDNHVQNVDINAINEKIQYVLNKFYY